jgi:hypothetical protein
MSAYRVLAYNTAHDSENKIERGTAECRFTSPVYDGETAEVTGGGEGGDAISIEVRSRGELCATGSAQLASQPGVPAMEKYPVMEAPFLETRPAASAASLPAGSVLGTQSMEASVDFMQAYLRDVRETDDLYRREGLVHPGNVLRMCNFALYRNVKLGPWLHVGSRVRNLGAGRAGETLSARALVAANYEKKGHRFVELDVLVLAAARPVAQVLHTAIYQPRQAAQARVAS